MEVSDEQHYTARSQHKHESIKEHLPLDWPERTADIDRAHIVHERVRKISVMPIDTPRSVRVDLISDTRKNIRTGP